MLNEATKSNLRRKSVYIDDVQIIDDTPLFSWIDINPTELCNRKCVFCPRVHEEEYPNQQLHMDLGLAQKIADDLIKLNYQGVIVFSGFGEPMMHPQFTELVSIFKDVCRLEIVTNGDFLKEKKITELHQAGLDYFVVSMYDGPEQRAKFNEKFSNCGLDESHYILRDRWHNEEDSFGLKLTNRAGTINVGDQAPIDVKHPCYYTAYSLTLDWNGDVLLCMQDWNRKVKFGNLHAQTLMDVWTSRYYNQFRKKLLNGSRACAPCSGCNTDGTLHGHEHAKIWRPIIK
ncbi:SPASM domain-containing protein [Paraglaciecola aquimarina]|uniref:SPASM domain-containing protein n=1 Tax=Paraglaciecola algarum TaxID=3050085 RepID=A0ABS9D5Z8_9ALTE|nr:radical SAM/SPASM domain-containing protein [Paraglaciecola sp. G1-23]MCF2948109.1 SPASM domain-containing protein [Paraglaciecola sp. G1-23]